MSQDRVHQGTSSPSAAVDEGVDRLELGVAERSEDQGGDIAAGHEPLEIIHQFRDSARRRGGWTKSASIG